MQRGIVAREQRDTARATVAALEATLAADRAAVENAKVQLQYATIRAPIQGRTGALMVNAGNLVRANDQTPLVTINQVTPIYVSFAFPEASLSDVAALYGPRVAARRGASGQRRRARAPSAASPSSTTPSIRRPERSRSRGRLPTRIARSGPASSSTSWSGWRPIPRRSSCRRLPSRPVRMAPTSTSSRRTRPWSCGPSPLRGWPAPRP